MSIDLLPEQQARLEDMARNHGRDVNDLVTEAALWLVQFQSSTDTRLEQSIAQADRGEFIEEDEMDARVARMLAAR